MFVIQRRDGKVWSHNGAILGERNYYCLEDEVLWTGSIGRPATWPTGIGAALATRTLRGFVREWEATC